MLYLCHNAQSLTRSFSARDCSVILGGMNRNLASGRFEKLRKFWTHKQFGDGIICFQLL